MKASLAFFSNLRRQLDPKPPIGERIEVEVQPNQTIREVVSHFLENVDEVAIILVNGIHQSLEYQIQDDDLKISLFPLSGGG